MSLAKFAEATSLIREHLVQEVAAGFPRLSRIPSSQVIKFLDYFAGLTEPDREALLDLLARGGALQFYSPRDSYDALLGPQEERASQRYRAAMLSAPYSMGLRHQDLRMIKSALGDPMSVAMMAQTRARLDFAPRDDLPPNLVPDPDPRNLKPAKAPLLRKLIDAAFKSSFGASRERRLGGEILHTGACEGTRLAIGIIFTNRGPQLIYHVKIPDESRTVFLIRFVYESLWSAGSGWDYLTEQNAEAAIALLGELILESVRLRNKMLSLLRQD
jgi:hypothetical protein